MAQQITELFLSRLSQFGLPVKVGALYVEKMFPSLRDGKRCQKDKTKVYNVRLLSKVRASQRATFINWKSKAYIMF